MKINIIFDSTGNIVGMASLASLEREAVAKAGEPDMEVGMATAPGQVMCEVEIPDELVQLEGGDLLQKLRELDVVKQALSTIPTAGQGESPAFSMTMSVPGQTMATAGQGESPAFSMSMSVPAQANATAGHI